MIYRSIKKLEQIYKKIRTRHLEDLRLTMPGEYIQGKRA